MTLPAVANPPAAVWIDSQGTFDANRVFSGIFTASGGITDQGVETDSPIFVGRAVRITRLMTTSSGGEGVSFRTGAGCSLG
jgi:hypothetical protein